MPQLIALKVQGNKLRSSDPLVAANVKLVATQFGDKCIGPLYQVCHLSLLYLSLSHS